MKRSTLIVVIVFVVLLGLALLLSNKPAERGTKSLNLSAVEPAQIEKITITAPGGETKSELLKAKGIWKLSDGHLADPDAIDRALTAIKEIQTSDVVSNSESRREKYGVNDKKGLKISLDSSAGSSIDLLLGSSDKGGSYLRRAGEDPIFKVQKNIAYLFPTENKRWLKLKLVDLKIEDLSGAEVALAGDQPLDLVPGDSDKEWKLKDVSLLPENFRFDGEAAKALVQQAVSTRASEIIDEIPEGVDTGLGDNEDRVRLMASGQTVALHLGKTAGDHLVWARVDGRSRFFKIPEYQATKLRKKLEDLRNLRLMNVEPEKLTDLRISSGKLDIHLQKGDQAWSIDESVSKPPKDFDFDPSMVESFLHSIQGLKAERYLGKKAGAGTGLNHPEIRVELDAAGSPPFQLLIGRAVSKKEGAAFFYAQGNADDAIYAIPGFQRERLERGWKLFQKPTPPPGGGLNNIDPQTLAKLPPEIRQQLGLAQK